MPDNLNSIIHELTLGDDQRAEQAAQRLIHIGEAAIPDLSQLISHPKPDNRWWAYRTLGDINHPDIPAILSRGLLDPVTDVQQCAAVGLCQQPYPKAANILASLLNSPDRLLARLAGNASIKIGKEAVPELLRILESGEQPARVEAARALAFIDDQQCIPLFLKYLQEGDSTMVEYWADLGLQHLGVGMAFFTPS